MGIMFSDSITQSGDNIFGKNYINAFDLCELIEKNKSGTENQKANAIKKIPEYSFVL